MIWSGILHRNNIFCYFLMYYLFYTDGINLIIIPTGVTASEPLATLSGSYLP